MEDKILLFDFDGTIAETLGFILRHATEACGRLGYKRKAAREDLDALEIMGFDELGRRLRIPEEEIDTFVEYVFDGVASDGDPIPIFKGIQEVIVRLAERNRIGIVTGNRRNVVNDFLEHYGLSAYVSAVVTLEDKGSRPEKIRKAARLLGPDIAEIYFIGDAVSDIRASKAASVISVAATWGHQSRSRLEREKPDLIAHSPADLLSIFCIDG